MERLYIRKVERCLSSDFGESGMKRKTYNNILKAGKLIQEKGYNKQESLEMAVKLFDQLEALHNGMSIEWMIEKLDTAI